MSEYMIFCMGEGRGESKGEGYQKNNRIFNKDVTHDEYIKTRDSLTDIKIYPTKWIEEKDMTDKEKSDFSFYKTTGGYLKVINYKNAWANWWKEASDSDKALILNIKQFDWAIFTAITGIEKPTEEIALTPIASIDEVIELNGHHYKRID